MVLRSFIRRITLLTVACRGLLMPGATAWLNAPFQILVLSSGIWRSLLLDIRCFVTSQYGVICTFANQRFGEVCWHNVQIQRRRGSGRAGGLVKELRAMESYKKQKDRYQLCLLLFINNVDLKNNNRNYRKSFW